MSATPYTVAAGQLVAQSTNGLYYRNTTGGTLAAGSVGSPTSLTLAWQAESPGFTYNVGGEAIASLSTPLPGVSISAAPGLAWITTQGTDDESDESLSQRCGDRWDALSPGAMAGYYRFWARAFTT